MNISQQIPEIPTSQAISHISVNGQRTQIAPNQLRTTYDFLPDIIANVSVRSTASLASRLNVDNQLFSIVITVHTHLD